MFVVNNPITVRWEIEPTDTPLEEADYDISVIAPTLKGSYTDAGVCMRHARIHSVTDV